MSSFNNANVRLPDFVIVGAQKAASSYITAVLDRHPEMYLPGGETTFYGDPRYFGKDEAERPSVALSNGIKRYGIKCADYLATEASPARLRDELHNPQLIAILRNPLERAVSAYFWYMRWGAIPICPIEDGLRYVLNGDYRAWNRASEILTWGLYGQHLERYLSYFARESMLVIVDRDLKNDRVAVISQIFRFLGVDPSFVPETIERPRNEGIYSLARLRFLALRNRCVCRDLDGYLALVRPKGVAAVVANTSIVGLDRVLLSRCFSNAAPTISGALRELLKEYYRADVTRLSALLERDLVTQWLA